MKQKLKSATEHMDEDEKTAKYKDVEWQRWPQFEEWLKSNHGMTAEFVPAFPSKRIDRARSRQNMARLGRPVNQERVTAMRVHNTKMKMMFHALIGLVDPEAKGTANTVLADGNHRDEFVVSRELENVGMYLLPDMSREKFSEISKAINTLEGETSSLDDRKNLAADSYLQARKQGVKLTVASVAAAYGIKPNTLSEFIRFVELKDRLHPDGTTKTSLPVPFGYERLITNRRAMIALSRITNDRVLHALAIGFAEIDKLLPERADEIVAVVLGEKASESAMLAKAHAELVKLQDDATKPGNVSTATRSSSAMTEGERLAENAVRFLNKARKEIPDDVDIDIRNLLRHPADRVQFIKNCSEIKVLISKFLKNNKDRSTAE